MEAPGVFPPLRPGDRCHVYEVVASLGTSGAAELYLVRGPTGDPCVLKLMAAPGADKERLRFAREGVALAKILHANVIRVFGVGAWGERAWFVIERFGGETLADRLRAGGPPPLDDLLGWVQQVCGGLAEAHRHGIVHRNLTPDSVVLGPGGLVKLGEFGMAKLASFGVVTTADQQLGCDLYAAPEQLRGKEEEVGPRADLYGLGLLLYEAITGVRPMGPGPYNTMKVVSWHVLGRAQPLHELVPSLPADLEALVHQMLEKDPALRPVSALEVHDRLQAVRVGLRAPLLREVYNAAPVERPVPLAPTQPMAAVSSVTPPGGDGEDLQRPGPRGWDRTAVLPAHVTVAATAIPSAPRIVAQEEARSPVPSVPEVSGEVRATGEPVESEIRRSRPPPRLGWVIGAGVLMLAAVGAAIGWTLWIRPTVPAQGAGSAPPALPVSASATPVSPPAPAVSASAPTASPRSPGGGASKRAGAPAPRTPGPTPRAKN